MGALDEAPKRVMMKGIKKEHAEHESEASIRQHRL
jgi:hypothetical protein